MAKHKAPTQVSIASTQTETAFSAMVKSYGMPALVIAILISLIILFREWQSSGKLDASLASWEELGRDVTLDEIGILSAGLTSVSTVAMESFAETHGDSPAAGWAKALELGQHLRDGNDEGVQRTLSELQEQWPDHILNNQALFVDSEEEGAKAKLLADHLSSRSAALQQWMADNKQIFEPTPMPADAPKVRFNTSKGSFVIGLRSAETPNHCANFLRLCEEGFYDNMTFFEVEQDKLLKTGSVASKDPNLTEEWGNDDHGPSIKPEIGNLWNYQFAVGASASATIPSESSDCRFYIVSGTDAHDLDRERTVFGAVVEGQEVIQAINDGQLLGTTPQDPVVIQSTEIL